MADMINRTASLESVGMRSDFMGIEVTVRPERINYHRLGQWMAQQNPGDIARFFDGMAELITEYNEKHSNLGDRMLAEIDYELDAEAPQVDYLFEKLHTQRKDR